MYVVPHPKTRPPFPIPPFFASVQNLSSKQIVPTDNMYPNRHDVYTHHLWLKRVYKIMCVEGEPIAIGTRLGMQLMTKIHTQTVKQLGILSCL